MVTISSESNTPSVFPLFPIKKRATIHANRCPFSFSLHPLQNFCAKKKLIINQLRLFFENNFPKSLVRWNRNYTFAAAFRKPRFLESFFRKIYLDII